MTLTVLDTFILVAFIAAVVTVGLLESRRERDSESYFLAGRALGGGSSASPSLPPISPPSSSSV